MKIKISKNKKMYLLFIASIIIFVALYSRVISYIYAGSVNPSFSMAELIESMGKEWFLKHFNILGMFILSDTHLLGNLDHFEVMLYALLIGISIIMCIYNLTFYGKKKEEKHALLIGLFCIIVILRQILSDKILVGDFSWILHFRLYFLSYLTYLPIYIMYLDKLYPSLISPLMIKINKISLGLYSILILLSPLQLHSAFFILFQLIITMLMAYSLFRLINKAFREFNEYSLVTINTLLLFLTSIFDFINKYLIHSSLPIGSLGLLFFFIIESYHLADKYAESFKNVEGLSERLKRNNLLKDDFLTYISKELKSPMSSIIGLTESIVSEDNPLSSEQLLNTKLINYSAVQLYRLVDDMLDFSKLNSNNIVLDNHPVDLKQLTDIIILITKSSLQNKNVSIINNISSELPLIYGDINRLQQIITNLLDSSLRLLTQGTIIFSATLKDNMAVITLEDDGSGIPFWKLNNIFNAYKINDENGVSSNLSLNLTKKLIELHGGTIEISSSLGKGSTISFTLPICGEEEGEFSISTKTMDNLLKNYKVNNSKDSIYTNEAESQNILIIDNDPAGRKLLEHYLIQEGYRTIAVSSGKEGMAVIDNIKDLDLVIVNLFMPDILGYDLCSLIRKKKNTYDLPILMLTSNSKSQGLILSFESGANDYLIRPADKTELLARVRTLLALKEYSKETSYLYNQINYTTQKMADLTDDMKKVKELDKLKTEFFSNISHELKTPLNVIWTSVQLLNSLNLQDIEPKISINKYLSIMNQNCLRLIRLINNIIDITKIDGDYLHIDPTNEDIVYVVEEIVTSVVSYAEAQGQNLIFDTEVEERLMSFDQEKIERILLNLLSNAIKFTPKGGTIEVLFKDFNDYVRIIVKDNGIGIPKDKIGLIFDRFNQVDKSLSRKREGSGIGLSLVISVVALHGGTIKAESEYGIGSSFIIDLPVKIEESSDISTLYDKLIPTSNKIDKINIEFSDIYSY